MLEVLIVGGSVAGLGAALLLGRCRRSVVICDTGLPRNRFSHHMHGFLSREGIAPAEFLDVCREQLLKFPNVQLRDGQIISIERDGEAFRAETKTGEVFVARAVLLATGIIDELPPIPGIEALYGTSVHHCPYCDGWEHQDEAIAVYGPGDPGMELALEMLSWSADIIYFSDGESVRESGRLKLQARGIGIIETKIAALHGHDGHLARVILADGECIDRKALFFMSSQRQNCDLASKLGCELKEGFVVCGTDSATNVPGLFAAGNTSSGLQLAIVAAAEGAKAAHSINTLLSVDLSEK